MRATQGCSKEVVEKFADWCMLETTQGADGIMCSLEDGRYFNMPNESSGVGVNMRTCLDHQQATCASRNILAGEELVQSYELDDLDDEESTVLLDKLIDNSAHVPAGSGQC